MALTADFPRAAAAEADGPPALEWRVDPWRDHPRRAALAAALALGMCALIAALGLPVLATLVLCVLTLAWVAPALAPERCRVDQAGVGRRGPFGWERRAWGELRRARVGPRGVMVSPFSRPRWLDRYRALILPLPRRGGETLAAEVARRLAEHGL